MCPHFKAQNYLILRFVGQSFVRIIGWLAILKEKDVLMQEVISFVFGAFATVILVKLSNSARLIFLSEHFSNSAAACVELSPSLAIGARVVTHAALILMTARCSRHTQRFDARTCTTKETAT